MSTPLKYQVFVSSTYEDLKDERQAVIKGILEIDHIPIGMEMFSAANEDQWEIIKRAIETSDYYVVILAHRFGSATGGTSYTRREYEHAVASGVPVLGFIISKTAAWPTDRVDRGEDFELLDEFKTLVGEKPVSFWNNAEDLKAKCAVSLFKAFEAEPRPGWIRSMGPPSTGAVVPIIATNESLAEVHVAMVEPPSYRDDSLREIYFSLAGQVKNFSYKKIAGGDWFQSSIGPNLATVFLIVTPDALFEVSTDSLSRSLAVHVLPDYETGWVLPTNQIEDLMVKYMSFGLVEVSSRTRSADDPGHYWVLTSAGRDLLTDVHRTTLAPGA